MDKNSFLIYLDYEEQFNLLTDEQIGQLMRAIIKYEKTGEIPKLDGMLKMAFSFIKTQLDRDREKWKEEKHKRSEAGKRGMAKRWNNKDNDVINNNNKNNNVKNVINCITKITDNVDVDVDDNVDVNVNEDVLLEKENKEKEEKLQQRFIECLNSFNINAISECISYLKDLPYEVIESVLEKTSRIKNPNWAYAKKILDDYVVRKIDTMDKVATEKEIIKNKESPEENFETIDTSNFTEEEYANELKRRRKAKDV